jgi:diguanylate cyclase (GGDEF)-like protein
MKLLGLRIPFFRLPSLSRLGLKLPKPKISPAVRISFGMISLILGWILLLDMMVGFWPDTGKITTELRAKTAELLAMQSAQYIQARDFDGLKKVLEDGAHEQAQIRSIAVRHKSGRIVLQVGDHALYWKPKTAISTQDFARLGITAGSEPWGEVEIAFVPSVPQTPWDWLRDEVVVSILLLIVGGFAMFLFYLRGVFSYLNPSTVVPSRVSSAFDAFSEGVLMVDNAGKVMIANKMFRTWGEDLAGDLFGKHAKELSIIKNAMGEDPKAYPWTKSMEALQSVNGWPLKITLPSKESIKVIINCSLIQDATNVVRGCMVTFADVTEIDKVNQNLNAAMGKLKKSQDELQEKNEELYRLATRDPMTGAFNRRSFFAEAEKILEEHRINKQPLCAIMSDIDHFKKFNDVHGHAIGDKVIIAFAKSLGVPLRTSDMLCRYGGEEFVVLLPGASPKVALDIAERLRQEVEQRAGPSIRHTVPLNITSSFGVAQLEDDVVDLTMLIDRADQGLYVAKKSGRNRVKFYGEPIEENAPPEEPRDLH